MRNGSKGEGGMAHILYSNRSACHAILGNAEAALKDAEVCVDLHPDWPRGHARCGVALLKLGRLEEALQAYQIGLGFEEMQQGAGGSGGVEEKKSMLLTSGLKEVEAAMALKALREQREGRAHEEADMESKLMVLSGLGQRKEHAVMIDARAQVFEMAERLQEEAARPHKTNRLNTHGQLAAACDLVCYLAVAYQELAQPNFAARAAEKAHEIALKSEDLVCRVSEFSRFKCYVVHKFLNLTHTAGRGCVPHPGGWGV